MPIRRLPDPVPLVTTPCFHPEHAPPMHIVLEPGTYEHTCPGCGAATVFVVNRPVWSGTPTSTITPIPTIEPPPVNLETIAFDVPLDAAAREAERRRLMDDTEMQALVHDVVSRPEFRAELERRLAPYRNPPTPDPVALMQPIKMRLFDVGPF